MRRIMAISLLDKENTELVIVDVQEKLMGVMGQKERVVDRVLKLLDLARVFQLPVIFQILKKAGSAEFKALLKSIK